MSANTLTKSTGCRRQRAIIRYMRNLDLVGEELLLASVHYSEKSSGGSTTLCLAFL